MSRLVDLLSDRLSSPIEEQKRVNDAIEHAVRAGPLGWRTPDGPVPSTGLLVVVGVMPAWNSYDRELLVMLERAAARLEERDRIEVFNADVVSSPEDLDAFIPGSGAAPQAPFLGVWRDGEFWFRDWGSSATSWLCDRYGASIRDSPPTGCGSES